MPAFLVSAGTSGGYIFGTCLFSYNQYIWLILGLVLYVYEPSLLSGACGYIWYIRYKRVPHRDRMPCLVKSDKKSNMHAFSSTSPNTPIIKSVCNSHYSSIRFGWVKLLNYWNNFKVYSQFQLLIRKIVGDEYHCQTSRIYNFVLPSNLSIAQISLMGNLLDR